MKHLILFFCTVVILASCQRNDTPAPSTNNNNTINTTAMTPTEQALVGTWRWYKTEHYNQGNISYVTDTNYYIANGLGGTYITELKSTTYSPQPGPANPPIAIRYSSLCYQNLSGYANGYWYVEPSSSYYNANLKSQLWGMNNPHNQQFVMYIDSLTNNVLVMTSWGTVGPAPNLGTWPKYYFYK